MVPCRGNVLLHSDRAFSVGLNGYFGGKTEIISDCRVYIVFFFLKNRARESHRVRTTCKPKSLNKIACSVWPKIKILKYSQRVSNNINNFCGNWLSVNFWVFSFLSNPCPWVNIFVLWLGEFLHYKNKTLFRVAWHFWTNTFIVDYKRAFTQASYRKLSVLNTIMTFHCV